eukprot:7519251-Pyramimonas_sp.AAC.1
MQEGIIGPSTERTKYVALVIASTACPRLGPHRRAHEGLNGALLPRGPLGGLQHSIHLIVTNSDRLRERRQKLGTCASLMKVEHCLPKVAFEEGRADQSERQ